VTGEFEDKRILVTSGTWAASEAIAERFLVAGGTVIVTAGSAPEQKADSYFIQSDFSSEEGAANVIREVLERFRGVDIIVHCVGGFAGAGGCFLTLPNELWKEAIHETLLPYMRLDRGLLPSMIKQGSGVILHVSSRRRLIPLYEWTLANDAAEEAMTSYSMGLSKEVGSRGVRVVAVSPGFFETDSATTLIETMATREGSDVATARHKLMGMWGGIPLGNPPHPGEVAELVACVAADLAATGIGTEFLMEGRIIARF